MATLSNFLNELQFGRIEKPVKDHLKNVYGAMSLALLSCALGSYIHMTSMAIGGGLLTGLGSLVILFALLAMEPRNETLLVRLGLLNGFAFLSGLSLGPLLEYSMIVDPQIAVTALLVTSLVFICFTFSALMAGDRKFLALGGLLLSGLSTLLILGLLNIFFGSTLLFQVHLYVGLALFCGFVLYDTQLIVEKCRQGDCDYIRHCLDLFLDFIGIFRHLLVILTEKERRSRRRNSDS